MKTKSFFTILIGLVMTINTSQAQMYVIGVLDPSNMGNIGFMIDYKGSDDVNELEILMDSTGGNNWTCIQKMPPYLTAYTMINPIPNSSYLFVAGKDTSNVLYYTSEKIFNIIIKSNDIKVFEEERKNILSNKRIEYDTFIITKAEGVWGSIYAEDTIPIVAFSDIETSMNTNDIGQILVNWQERKWEKREFRVPKIKNGTYTIIVNKDDQQWSKSFEIK